MLCTDRHGGYLDSVQTALKSSISAAPKTNLLCASFPTLETSLLSIGESRHWTLALFILLHCGLWRYWDKP
jgi:hypothetical protein